MKVVLIYIYIYIYILLESEYNWASISGIGWWKLVELVGEHLWL
ncbi:MAG: hypothetical protein N7Q72_07410 [Spiroplasma sp. Tabriz.8]|nr:hypothetical protein [Spiroplasma sp. Tabriz.8]